MRVIKTTEDGFKYFEVESDAGAPQCFFLPDQPYLWRLGAKYFIKVPECGVDDPLPEQAYDFLIGQPLRLWRDRYILSDPSAEAWIVIAPNIQFRIVRYPFIDSLGNDVMGWHLKLPTEDICLGPVDSVAIHEAQDRARAEVIKIPIEQLAAAQGPPPGRTRCALPPQQP